MFVVEFVTLLTTILFIRTWRPAGESRLQLPDHVWLWITVLFANFAEALAEGRGKAQADALRRTRTETQAKLLAARIDKNSKLVAGDESEGRRHCLCRSRRHYSRRMARSSKASPPSTSRRSRANRHLSSAKSGGDRSAVTGGTHVLSDWIRVRVTAAHGHDFLDRMIALVEGAERQKTPNEIALNILLAGMTIIFLFAVGDDSQLCGLCGRGPFRSSFLWRCS